jgi:hypothetical protein
MYRKALPIILLVCLLLLAACSTGASSDSTSAASTPGYETSPEMKLLIGTLKLDGTDQEVGAAQAEELLPLWQMLKSLASSDTTAQEELEAVVKQIQDTMTSDQMTAINAMNLTPQDMFTAMQDLGLSMGASTPDSSSGQQGNLPAGGFPSGGSAPSGATGPAGGAGGPPSGGVQPSQGGGGDMGGFSGGMDPNAVGGPNSTPQASGAGGAQMRLPTQLLDALIEYLQKQAQS